MHNSRRNRWPLSGWKWDESRETVTNNDAYEARAVKLGDRLTDSVVVTSGLSTGEQVVIKGAYALKSRQLKSQISDEH